MKIVQTGTQYKYGAPIWERPHAQSKTPQAGWSLDLVFDVKAASDAHIWLNGCGDPNTRNLRRGYEIVLGARNNSDCYIRKGQQGMESDYRTEGPGRGPLCGEKAEKFWIAVTKDPLGTVTIEAGCGIVVGSSRLVRAVYRNGFEIFSVSLSTGFGSAGEWTIMSTHFYSLGRLDGVDIETPEEPREFPKTVPNIVRRTSVGTPARNSLMVRQDGGDLAGGSLLKRPKSSAAAAAVKKRPLAAVSIVAIEKEREIVQSHVDKAMAKFSTRT
jgi:hypothetical protein